MTADSWPEFRGPGAQGISTATNVPVNWSATNNIEWKVAVPGKGWSSPVLADGKIYLSMASEIEGSPDISLRVLCLSAEDGRTLWNVEAIHPDSSAVQARHMKNSLASPTPIIHGDRLFAHFGHMGTACLTLDGKVVWRQQELQYPPMHGNGGSPVLVDSELVFSCDGAENPFVAALDAKTSRVNWITPRDTPARNKFSFSIRWWWTAARLNRWSAPEAVLLRAITRQMAANFGGSITAMAIQLFPAPCCRAICFSSVLDLIHPSCMRFASTWPMGTSPRATRRGVTPNRCPPLLRCSWWAANLLCVGRRNRFVSGCANRGGPLE